MGPWGARPGRQVEISVGGKRNTSPPPLAEAQSACTQCGAVLAFDPGAKTLTCTYCGTANTISVPDLQIVEHDLALGLEATDHEELIEEAIAVDCASCQAVFSFEPNQHAGECPFCGHPIVKDSGRHRQIKPEAILPFAVAESSARKAIEVWLKQLWFAPSKLRQMARKDGRLHGIYVPYWTFDSDVTASYRGRRGDIYMEPRRVTVTVNGRRQTQTRMVQKIRWRAASGRVHRHFNDILVLASRSLPEWMAERLGPWNLGGLKPYSPLFVQGFQAQTYNLPLASGFDEAEREIQARMASDIRMDIGGDLQQIQSMKLGHEATSFKHILLPLWLGVYRYGGRTYHVSINGQTSEVQGERPYSWVKMLFAAFVIMILVALLIAGFSIYPPR